MVLIGSIIGKKVGMTSIFDESGVMVPVTAIEAGPVTVLQVKRPDKDGYAAIQVGYGEKKMQRAKKPELEHARKAGASPKMVVREIRVPAEDLDKYKPGQEIKLADLSFEKGDFVDVVGKSIGKGYSGVMKRHNFAGAKASHGVHEYKRHGGSIGTSATPSRVLKGKKMAGHLGDSRVTVQNLVVAGVRAEENLILIRGAVPGARNGTVTVRFAKKRVKKPAAAVSE